MRDKIKMVLGYMECCQLQSWIDSFHTGYNLDAISMYQNCTNDNQFSSNLDKGFAYYIANFLKTMVLPNIIIIKLIL